MVTQAFESKSLGGLKHTDRLLLHINWLDLTCEEAKTVNQEETAGRT